MKPLAILKDSIRESWDSKILLVLLVLSLLFSLLLAVGVLMPLWQALQRDTERLQQLEQLATQVMMFRNQLRAEDIQEEKALEQKDVVDGLAVMGLEAKSSTPAELTKLLKESYDRWGPIVKKIGFTADS